MPSIAKKGDKVAFGCVFRDAGAAGGDVRGNPTQPTCTIVNENNVLVITAAMVNVPVPGVIAGLWQYVWNTVGIAAGSYTAYMYDAVDPITHWIASPGAMEVRLEDHADLDDVFDELREIEDNKGTYGTAWNPALHNLVATNVAAVNADANAALAAADANAAKIAAVSAKDRLGADADTYPVGAQTKYLAGVATPGSPVAGTVAAELDAILAGIAALPSSGTIADAVWDELVAGHAIAGSYGKTLPTFLGVGLGAVFVNHDTGGVDNLKMRDAATLASIQEGVVRIFLKADWDAGNRSTGFVKAWWSTDVNGRAVNGCFLSAATYTAVAYRTRAGSQVGYKVKTKEFTVS